MYLFGANGLLINCSSQSSVSSTLAGARSADLYMGLCSQHVAQESRQVFDHLNFPFSDF